MKERNILFFISALILSVLLLLSVLIRTQIWFDVNNYGKMAVPTIHYLLIPVVLLWLAWYFESDQLLLSSAILVSVVFILHLDYAGLLSNDPFVSPTYAPAVKTAYVLSFILLLATIIFAMTAYIKKMLKQPVENR